MRHAAFVLLLIPGDLAILLAGFILSSRYVKQEEFDHLPTWQRLVVSKMVGSAIGATILGWSGLLFWLLW
jgi:membrane protein DedA with SNARE-associated domain